MQKTKVPLQVGRAGHDLAGLQVTPSQVTVAVMRGPEFLPATSSAIGDGRPSLLSALCGNVNARLCPLPAAELTLSNRFKDVTLASASSLTRCGEIGPSRIEKIEDESSRADGECEALTED